MTTGTTEAVHHFDRYDDILAALADPALVPERADEPEGPEGPEGPGGTGGTGGTAQPGTMAWLRARVARFSAGETHARRRALVEAELARVDLAALRVAPDTGEGEGEDDDAGPAVVAALAEALGMPDPAGVARAVAVVAGAYFGAGDAPEADAALAWLLPRVQGGTEAASGGREAAANRIGLLVQACDATAALVRHARRAPEGPAADRVRHALRHDPPVRAMRRVAARATRVGEVAVARGDRVLLDVAVAQRDGAVPVLTFGAPPRRCPGERHALALAESAVERELRGTGRWSA
ncbi:hypothetical protein [Streptomyces boncukensis]|uniref:Cytochrome P450 n=1 Tax=Streptomyces boncukensis TaxID=2711219 RepID=A0A6G4WTY3_9ACTN|nr:hypothetical protein [Streptomyces boncukensis]NGO68087.1 hypothetical protein [Streptomyces boncukensis]